MIKILFLIHDLGQGGAEKVLVNLVNNMDKTQFNVTVIALFGGGVNEQFLDKDICFRTIFPREVPANSKLMKLLSPKMLHNLFIKERYDIEVSYLEGPSARIISGCSDSHTKLVSWIHVEQHTQQKLSASFRNFKEAKRCYERYDKTICVSEYVKNDFCNILSFRNSCCVLYNTVESDKILEQGNENVDEFVNDGRLKLVAVGTLKESKGYDRLLRIVKKLDDKAYPIHLYILGVGPIQSNLEKYIAENNLKHCVTLLGYQTNPYKYVSKCDLFVCASHAEGFSTAATEALILGVPVCTVEVSGMKEMLGQNNDFGIVTDNSEDALQEGIETLISENSLLSYYKNQAVIRGKDFNTQSTVDAVEEMLLKLIEG